MFDLPKLEHLLTADDFEPWIGQAFQVAADPAPVQIELISLSRRAAAFMTYRQPFVLVFRSAWSVLLVDGLYTLSRDCLGPHAIFLAALAPTSTQRLYQATFN
ncbi:MAG: DUF6916 family protein [Caulobacteraceae bacterium]